MAEFRRKNPPFEKEVITDQKFPFRLLAFPAATLVKAMV